MAIDSVEYQPAQLPDVPFAEPSPDSRRLTSHGRALAFALALTLMLGVVLLMVFGPSAGAAGGCGGG